MVKYTVLTMLDFHFSEYRTKYEVTELLTRNQDEIQALFKDNSFVIGYSPCKQTPCENGGSCSDHLAIYDDARITDSQALILTSPRVLHEMNCKCRDGFTGDRCEKRQDPCSPNPCLLVSACQSLRTIRKEMLNAKQHLTRDKIKIKVDILIIFLVLNL